MSFSRESAKGPLPVRGEHRGQLVTQVERSHQDLLEANVAFEEWRPVDGEEGACS